MTQSPRTASVPLPILARRIAGLAEAIQIRLRERDDIDHLRTTVGQLAHALSALGQVTADAIPAPDNDTSRASAGDGEAGRDDGTGPGQPHRPLPRVGCRPGHRRVLPKDFNAAHAQQLADTFQQDAASLRYFAGE